MSSIDHRAQVLLLHAREGQDRQVCRTVSPRRAAPASIVHRGRARFLRPPLEPFVHPARSARQKRLRKERSDDRTARPSSLGNAPPRTGHDLPVLVWVMTPHWTCFPACSRCTFFIVLDIIEGAWHSSKARWTPLGRKGAQARLVLVGGRPPSLVETCVTPMIFPSLLTTGTHTDGAGEDPGLLCRSRVKRKSAPIGGGILTIPRLKVAPAIPGGSGNRSLRRRPLPPSRTILFSVHRSGRG